jgi:hypothetical protein
MELRKVFFGVMIALGSALGMLALIPPVGASAQTPDRLSSLKISVWPEYDKPTVLVMFDGVLADTLGLPRPISVLIPPGAQLSVATFQNPDTTLAPEQPTQETKQADGSTLVTFTTSQPQFRVEYYHDLLRGAPDKTLDYTFKSIAPVDALTLEIQQPLKATNFVLAPSTQATRTDSDGLHYFDYAFTNVAAGQTVSVQAKYTKTDPHPSVMPAASYVPAASAQAASTAAGSSSMIFLAALIAVGIIAVVGFILFQRHSLDKAQRSSTPARRQRRAKRRGDTVSDGIFCTQCGRPLKSQDNFCPKCGTALRARA